VEVSFMDERGVLRYWHGPTFWDCDPDMIGRHVDDCHAPRSRTLIEQLVAAFRSGEKDQAYVWSTENGRRILSRYAAVKDADGAYRGTLETIQDITRLEEIAGEPHALVW
jgi:uncharacterized protein